MGNSPLSGGGHSGLSVLLSRLCHREVIIVNQNTEELLTLPDGRQLAYVCAGDPAGDPVVWNSGTPQGAGLPPAIVR